MSEKLASSGSEIQMLSQHVAALRHHIDGITRQHCRRAKSVGMKAQTYDSSRKLCEEASAARVWPDLEDFKATLAFPTEVHGDFAHAVAEDTCTTVEAGCIEDT